MGQRPWFGRDPALWSQAVLAALAVVQMFFPGLPDSLVAIVAGVLAAAAGTFTAIHVKPLAPTVFTTLIAALAPLVAFFGVHVSQAQIGALQLALATVIGLAVRSASTPRWDPIEVGVSQPAPMGPLPGG